MADIYFSDWDKLVKAVDDQIEIILEKDVAPVAEGILRRHIQTDIYDAYTPVDGGYFGGKWFESAYQRRGTLANSVYSFMSGHNELIITSDAEANTPVYENYTWSLRHPGAFLEMIENGGFGLWKNGFPRPAVSNAQSEIDSSSRIASAIKQGIKREIGICIEI